MPRPSLRRPPKETPDSSHPRRARKAFGPAGGLRLWSAAMPPGEPPPTSAVEILHPPPPSARGAGRCVIEVAHLRKLYGSTVAVDDVSFEVLEGEIFGLIGPQPRRQDHGMRRGRSQAAQAALRARFSSSILRSHAIIRFEFSMVGDASCPRAP